MVRFRERSTVEDTPAGTGAQGAEYQSVRYRVAPASSRNLFESGELQVNCVRYCGELMWLVPASGDTVALPAGFDARCCRSWWALVLLRGELGHVTRPGALPFR